MAGRHGLLLAVVLALGGCGRSTTVPPPPSEPPPGGPAAPAVVGFSPLVRPLDFATFQQDPAITNGLLTLGVDPAGTGEIHIEFDPGVPIDPASLFLQGDPALGPSPAAVSLTRFVPGVGNVDVALASASLDSGSTLVMVPAQLPLVDGQYAVGVFTGVRSVEGVALPEPAFHTFHVGNADPVVPTVIRTVPEAFAVAQPAGIFSEDVVIRLSEPIASSSLSVNSVAVYDIGSPGRPPLPVLPAPGFPMLKSQLDGATLPSNGHEIVWRPDRDTGGFHFGSAIEVRLEMLRDLNGNLVTPYTFVFQTDLPPP